MIDRIGGSPGQIADHQTTDAKGGPTDHLFLEELRENVLEAIEGCLAVEFDGDPGDDVSEVIEVAV